MFVARNLRPWGLQWEIEKGLNVMESLMARTPSSPTAEAEIASSRRDEQEMFVRCVRIPQSAPVYVNMFMLQEVLDEPEWTDLLSPPTGVVRPHCSGHMSGRAARST
ncbi:Tn3 family transposase [Streptomyces sp. NPDC059985]|uniref:Tn3 family transposase n=1 Tax=Streptomyces sp. NPDC059985 TaxID=3347025 RepID=UPI003685DF99